MSTTITHNRKNYVERPVQRIRGSPKGYYWVRSETHKQLWYKVILYPEYSNGQQQLYCSCDYFQHTNQVCKHMMKIVKLEVGV